MRRLRIFFILGLIVFLASCTKSYTVVFDLDGGTHLSGGTLIQEVNESENALLPVVHKEGYVFDGWTQSVNGVVQNINTTAKWRNYTQEEIYENSVNAVVEITTYDKSNDELALGSGFFFNDNSEIITNYHVIEGATALKITLNDGTQHDITKVIAYDQKLDLAILKTDYLNPVFLDISLRTIQTGENVYALGSSKGFTNTFTSGNISQVDRVIDDVNVFQMTAPISSGNSGGPLIDMYGKVIGVNAMKYTDGDNIYFSIKLIEMSKLDMTNPLSVIEFAQQTDPLFMLSNYFLKNGELKSLTSGEIYYQITYYYNGATNYYSWYPNDEELTMYYYDNYYYYLRIDFDDFPFFYTQLFDDNVSSIGYDDNALFSRSSISTIIYFDGYYESSYLRTSYQDLLEISATLMLLVFDNYAQEKIGVNFLDNI